MDYITLMIIFIVIYILAIFAIIIAWILYIFCEVSGLTDIFLYLLPKCIQAPLWNIPEGIIKNTKEIFVCITLFLIIMYILWLIIQFIIPEFILVIPIRKILSEIRPFPDLNEAGIFKLFDNIVSVFTTREKLLKKLGLSGELVKDFFLTSTAYIRENFEKNIDNDKIMEKEILSNNKKENKENTDKIIEIEKNNCIMKNNIQFNPDHNNVDKIKINIDYAKNITECELNSIGSKIQQNIVL